MDEKTETISIPTNITISEPDDIKVKLLYYASLKVNVHIDYVGVIIGPIINRNNRSFEYFKVKVLPIHTTSDDKKYYKLKHYDLIFSNDQDMINFYFDTHKKSNHDKHIIIDCITLVQQFYIEGCELDHSKKMTNLEMLDDLDYMNEILENMRKIIDNSSSDRNIVCKYNDLLHNNPHKIFEMNSCDEYFKYLDEIDKLLDNDDMIVMERVNKNFSQFKF